MCNECKKITGGLCEGCSGNTHTLTTQTPNQDYDDNKCPSCGCLYDDKQKGLQGRNGACECSCGHRSPKYILV